MWFTVGMIIIMWSRAVIKSWGLGIFPGFYEHGPRLLSLENRRKIEPKEISSCFFIRHLLVVFARQLEILLTALVKLLWDFRIQTDHHLDHNRPDIVVLEKEGRMCFIVNVACPFDTRVAEKEREKIDHYQDLKGEVQKIWNCRSVSVIIIVTGALRIVSKHLRMWVSKLETPGIIALLQKACLFGTA